MASSLADDEVWREIRRQAARSKSLTAIVAYVGTHPDRLLKWPRRSTLIADLSEASVAQGISSAKGALRIVNRVRIYHLDALHAKCYLFDRAAVVTSANLSSSGLREAGVLLAAPAELKTIRAYVHRVLSEAIPMSRPLLQGRTRFEPARRPHGRRHASRTRGFPLGARVWMLVAREDTEDSAAERKAKQRWADAEGHVPNSLDWLNGCGLKIYHGVSEGDTVFFWEAPSQRRPLGYITGPFISRGGADLDRRLGTRRYALAIQRRPVREAVLDKKRMEQLRLVAGYRRGITHSEAPERAIVPPRRLRVLARLVGIHLVNGQLRQR